MSAADRLYDKKWGVFTHYLAGIQNNPANPLNQGAGRTEWNECVNAFDREIVRVYVNISMQRDAV